MASGALVVTIQPRPGTPRGAGPAGKAMLMAAAVIDPIPGPTPAPPAGAGRRDPLEATEDAPVLVAAAAPERMALGQVAAANETTARATAAVTRTRVGSPVPLSARTNLL